MVARPVGRKEVESNPEAKRALNKEWDRLRERPTWDETDGHEKRDVAKAAREVGYDVPFGRLHGITVEKGAELAKGDKNRYFKGRVVFLGNQVNTRMIKRRCSWIWAMRPRRWMRPVLQIAMVVSRIIRLR